MQIYKTKQTSNTKEIQTKESNSKTDSIHVYKTKEKEKTIHLIETEKIQNVCNTRIGKEEVSKTYHQHLNSYLRSS
jgi:hypothetical protein